MEISQRGVPESCGPCGLNGDDHPDVVARHGVMGFPTLNLYRDGEVVRQIVGAKPKRALLADLDGEY